MSVYCSVYLYHKISQLLCFCSQLKSKGAAVLHASHMLCCKGLTQVLSAGRSTCQTFGHLSRKYACTASCLSHAVHVQANSSNKLLGVRGNAGSHDTKLAHETFQALKAAKADSAEVGIVRYDKSKHEGRGDRAAKSEWQMVKGPVDVVLFEGWMLGFSPLSDVDAEKVPLANMIHMHCF